MCEGERGREVKGEGKEKDKRGKERRIGEERGMKRIKEGVEERRSKEGRKKRNVIVEVMGRKRG